MMFQRQMFDEIWLSSIQPFSGKSVNFQQVRISYETFCKFFAKVRSGNQILTRNSEVLLTSYRHTRAQCKQEDEGRGKGA